MGVSGRYTEIRPYPRARGGAPDRKERALCTYSSESELCVRRFVRGWGGRCWHTSIRQRTGVCRCVLSVHLSHHVAVLFRALSCDYSGLTLSFFLSILLFPSLSYKSLIL